ncbi:MAG: LUD domain-containing protein [Rhodothermales bacterium]
MSDEKETSTRNTGTKTSRASILAAVRRAKPAPLPLPDPREPSRGKTSLSSESPDELVERFMDAVEAAAGSASMVDAAGVRARVSEVYPEASLAASVDGRWDFEDVRKVDASNVDVLVCAGMLGVAENGAVWVPESGMGLRAAPFLAQHLVLVVSRTEIVEDMHAAYDRIRIDEDGFGAFIAGPSKTADIEQSLVIGAHGPRSLLVLLVP